MSTTKKLATAQNAFPKKSVANKAKAKKPAAKTRSIEVVEDQIVEPAADKTPSAKKTKATNEAKTKKVSAINAAAQVLASAKEPMNTKEMIEAMTANNLWTSPGGKTPHATLYSAILREINVKGKDARFAKSERGKFAAKA